jgi:hypothetical protein
VNFRLVAPSIHNYKFVRGLVPDRSPRVKYQAPRVPLHRTIMIYFGNSGFRSFDFSPLVFIRSVFSRIPPIAATCPSKSNGGSFLRDFRSFKTSRLDFLQSTFPQSCRSGAMRPLERMVNIYFENLGFGSFSFPALVFLQSGFSQSPQILAACPPQIDGRRSLPSSSSTWRPPPSSELPKYVAVISPGMWRSHQS